MSPVLKTVNFQDAQSGQVVPISVSQLPDGSYSLVVDERSIHNLGVGGAAFVSADASAAPAPITDAPATGQKIVCDELVLSSDTANITITITEETTGKILYRIYITTNQSIVLVGNDRFKLSTPNTRIMLQASKAGNVSATAFWYSEA